MYRATLISALLVQTHTAPLFTGNQVAHAAPWATQPAAAYHKILPQRSWSPGQFQAPLRQAPSLTDAKPVTNIGGDTVKLNQRRQGIKPNNPNTIPSGEIDQVWGNSNKLKKVTGDQVYGVAPPEVGDYSKDVGVVINNNGYDLKTYGDNQVGLDSKKYGGEPEYALNGVANYDSFKKGLGPAITEATDQKNALAGKGYQNIKMSAEAPSFVTSPTAALIGALVGAGVTLAALNLRRGRGAKEEPLL